MPRKRVSLTLSEELVDEIDSLDESKGENRSRKVESILKKHFSKSRISTAVVFCGDDRAKSLERYEGKTVIEHIIDQLGQKGVETVYLLAGPNREQIQQVFESKKSSTTLNYVSEGEANGNAAALKKLDSEISEPFAAVNGHVLTDVDLDEMFQVHQDTDSIATIALTAVQDPSNYGAARLKGDTILGFEEKPVRGEEPSKLINAGTYIFDPEIFQKLGEDSIEQLFEELAGKRQLSGYIYGGKWVDVSR
jgi:NDP-sugar pyrophosphorylase family protein